MVWKPIARSSMHNRHADLGAEFTNNSGWQRPAKYMDLEKEVAAITSKVGLIDISPNGKVTAQSTEMNKYMMASFHVVPNPDILECQLAQVMLEEGPSTVIVARLSYDELFIITFPGQGLPTATFLNESRSESSYALDVSSAFAGLQVIGPSAYELLSELTETNISESQFPNLTCSQSKVSEIGARIIRRDVRNTLSFDVYFPREYGEYIWDSFMHAGEHLGVEPVGTQAVSKIEIAG